MRLKQSSTRYCSSGGGLGSNGIHQQTGVGVTIIEAPGRTRCLVGVDSVEVSATSPNAVWTTSALPGLILVQPRCRPSFTLAICASDRLTREISRRFLSVGGAGEDVWRMTTTVGSCTLVDFPSCS